MLISLLLLIVGLVILTVGAEFLVRGASALALRCGLSPLVAGLTVVAFGTSAPELAVSVKAALDGSGGLALGNIVGSNTFNVAVILGLAALICPLAVHLQVLRREMPIMLAASAVFPWLAMTGGISRWEAAACVVGIILYVAFSVRRSQRETLEAKVPGEAAGGHLGLALGLIAGGLVLLVGGAKLMVDHASILARMLGVSEAVVGLTIVAAGTSMPELATSVVAALRKQTDIAIGNVVGSNIFNLLAIGGLTGVIAPPLVSAEIGWLHYGFMLGLSVLLMPLMWTGFTLKRWEGFLLVGLYGVYLYVLWPR